MKVSATALAGFYFVPRHVIGGPGFIAPSDRLRVAGIGVGGMGSGDIRGVFGSGKVDIIALCDVDDSRAKGSIEAHPKAAYYRDFRDILDKEDKNIDAVTVSTPDHNHAVQAMMAMQHGNMCMCKSL